MLATQRSAKFRPFSDDVIELEAVRCEDSPKDTSDLGNRSLHC